MKKSHFLVIVLLIGLTLTLSSCVSGPRVTGTPGISMSDETVVVAYGPYVFGLDVGSGSVLWHYPEKKDNKVVFYAQPLITDSAVYIGDLANNFHKLDISNGDVEWTFSDAKGYYLGQAAESDGVVYAPSNDGNLYAIDPDGSLLWAFETGHYIWAQPLITDDAILVASMDHSVYAVTKDGEEIWSTEMAGAVVGKPAINEDGSVMYVGSLGKEIAALDTSTGEILWTFDANETLESVWGNPIFIEDVLYFADASSQLFALDTTDITTVWQTNISGTVVSGLTALEDGIALATQEGTIKAVNLDGSPKWEATLEGEIYQAPAVNGDNLVVGVLKGDNLLNAFSTTGAQRWSTTPED